MQSKIIATTIISLLLITVAWTQWNKQTVDNVINAGKYTKIINDSTGTPHIFYVRDSVSASKYEIMHARWSGSGWDIERISTNGPNSEAFDVTLGPGGKWHLCWKSWGGTYIYYGYNIGGIWRDTVLTSYYFPYLKIGVDTLGLPHIVAFNQTTSQLVHWWYVQEFPGHWENERIEDGQYIRRPSFIIDSLNRIYVAYYNAGDLKLAYHNGTQWSTHIVDMPNDVGDYCDLKLNRDGNVCISYYDVTNGDLRYAVGTYSVKGISIEKSNQIKKE